MHNAQWGLVRLGLNIIFYNDNVLPINVLSVWVSFKWYIYYFNISLSYATPNISLEINKRIIILLFVVYDTVFCKNLYSRHKRENSCSENRCYRKMLNRTSRYRAINEEELIGVQERSTSVITSKQEKETLSGEMLLYDWRYYWNCKKGKYWRKRSPYMTVIKHTTN